MSPNKLLGDTLDYSIAHMNFNEAHAWSMWVQIVDTRQFNELSTISTIVEDLIEGSFHNAKF